uniref:RdRp n=1 Tax=Wenling partiti-like virus 8 TaxID=1923526 RepID=A0A1L3KLT3_9VIRU|nr:RdRp [Wenling partiti-like virus 8]
MPIGKINDSVYANKWRKARAQKWVRSWPNKHSVKIWWSKYQERQRIASKAKWDLPRWDSVVASLKHDLHGIRIDPLPLASAPSTFDDLGASPGLGLSGKKEYPTKGDIPMEEVDQMWRDLSHGRLHKIPDYSIAFRSHLVKEHDPPKARVVLVSPGPLAIVEKCWAEPLYLALKSTRFPKPWATGFDWFSGDGARILQTFNNESLSMDFSSFDLCAPTFMIRDVFRLIASCFCMNSVEEAVLDTIMRSHCYSWAKHGDRRYRMGGGIRTGSSLTHIIGTFVCILMTRYLTSEDVQSCSYGDDVVVNTSVPLQEIARRARETSSFTISESKSKKGVHWLGLKFVKGRWEVENEDRRWGQMFNPEYIGDNPDLQAQLLHSHLLAAGTGRMAAEIRGIIRRIGITSIFPAMDRQLRKAVYLPLATDQLTRAKNIFQAERLLKMNMENM